MKTHFFETQFCYDGTQLHSLFAYEKLGLPGDSLVAWIGPCQISFDHMVDLEDVRDKSEIRGDLMVHFILEKFNCSLLAAVGLQRLLASIVRDVLVSKTNATLRREGDDIFLEDRKLSISIATVSPVSALVHFAVNVVNDGTPVKTLALRDLGVDPREFSLQIMDAFSQEVTGIEVATQKVRWVR